ncbi:MAG TPA: hypothetical protein VF002_04165 [Gaiellaceae bacterium]
MLLGWWLFRDIFREHRWLRRFFGLFIMLEFFFWASSFALVLYLISRHKG